MARWLIHLEGEPFDSGEFPYWFPDGDIFCLAEGQAVYLTGSAFEKFLEPAQVYEAACQVVNECSAIILLLQSNFKKPSVGSIVREADNGERKQHHFLQANPIVCRSKLHASLTIANQLHGPRQRTQAQQLLAAFRADRHLALATLLVSDTSRNTWPRLYRALEEIENHLGCGVHDAKLCSEKERRRFTHTANTAEVAGDDARHASGKFESPKDPMIIQDAMAFITQILLASLQRIAPPEN